MSFPRRPRRPDEWSSNHARARSDLSDRLDRLLDPGEAAWLDGHLASCAECRSTATAYEQDRQALRALRDQVPVPPRDLWARTSAAIERESRFRDQKIAAGGSRRRLLVGSSFIAAALVVVVAVGTLTSSRLPGDGDHATPPTGGGGVAQASASPPDIAALPTHIPTSQQVHWITQERDGRYSYSTLDVRAVCPSESQGCDPGSPVQDQPVQLSMQPQSVFGSSDGTQLIVVNPADQGKSASVSVVRLGPLPSEEPSATPESQAPSSPVATPSPSATASPATASPVVTPPTAPSGSPSIRPSNQPSASPTPSTRPSGSPASASPPPSVSPSPSTSSSTEPSSAAPSATASEVAITPSPTADGTVEIAKNVVLVGQSAAYSRSGDWFAFTARPADGSAGPDIYVWKVGDSTARPVTTDHQSTFGSWTGGINSEMIVGSTVVATEPAPGDSTQATRNAVSFLLDPATGAKVSLPQTGRTWRPSVDPTGRRAVYWTGSLVRADGAPVDVPGQGRLVVGDWATGDAAAGGGSASAPAPSDQATARDETTIATGRIVDWDARWDPTGTKLAIWIADPDDPRVGTLSLYSVDPFDGRVDLKKPLLDGRRASTGFAISDGKLVWAEPAENGSPDGDRILVLAWTDQGVGSVETAPDNVLVIR